MTTRRPQFVVLAAQKDNLSVRDKMEVRGISTSRGTAGFVTMRVDMGSSFHPHSVCLARVPALPSRWRDPPRRQVPGIPLYRPQSH